MKTMLSAFGVESFGPDACKTFRCCAWAAVPNTAGLGAILQTSASTLMFQRCETGPALSGIDPELAVL